MYHVAYTLRALLFFDRVINNLEFYYPLEIYIRNTYVSSCDY